jgi:hypothetical protein
MKRYKLRKYEMPRMVQASLESEGIICYSTEFSLRVDPSNNINYFEEGGSPAEPLDIEF